MGIQIYSEQMPQRQNVAVDSNTFALTKDFWYFLNSIWNRTGKNVGGAIVQVGLVATVAPATLPMISADWNEFSQVPLNGACQLPALNAGADTIIFNFGANPLGVTPDPTQQIDALGLGIAYSLAITKMQWFRCTAQTQLRSMQLG